MNKYLEKYRQTGRTSEMIDEMLITNETNIICYVVDIKHMLYINTLIRKIKKDVIFYVNDAKTKFDNKIIQFIFLNNKEKLKGLKVTHENLFVDHWTMEKHFQDTVL